MALSKNQMALISIRNFYERGLNAILRDDREGLIHALGSLEAAAVIGNNLGIEKLGFEAMFHSDELKRQAKAKWS